MSTAAVTTRARTLARTRPGWWLTAAAGLAWAVMIADTVTGSNHEHDRMADPSKTMPGMDMSGMTMSDMGSHAPAQPVPSHFIADLSVWSGHWLLMVVAMMWPLYALPAAGVARASFRRWRPATVTAYVGAITLLWLAVGVVARTGYHLVEPVTPARLWSAAWLVLAAAATRSVWRARLLRTCGRLGVVAPAGWRGLRTAAECGLQAWPRCALLCGPVMLAMVATHSLPLMISGSAAVWWEQRHPRTWRDPVPAAVLAVTAVVLAAAVWWPTHW